MTSLFKFVSLPTSVPVENYHKPPAQFKTWSPLKTKVTRLPRCTTDVNTSMASAEGVLRASRDESFDTARTDASDDISISVSEVELNEKANCGLEKGLPLPMIRQIPNMKVFVQKNLLVKWVCHRRSGEVCSEGFSFKCNGDNGRKSPGWSST